MRVDDALRQARTQGLDRLDAQLLLAHVMKRPRTWLLAHGDAEIDFAVHARFSQLCAERSRRVPLAYLVGRREFWGLDLQVTPDVLDPRPDTEVLVSWALACLDGPLGHIASPAVADLGTGSGAIALALRSACPRASVVAVDRSAAALAVARGNAQRLGLDIETVQGHWIHALQGRPFDLIVSNPPYLSATDRHLPDLHAEPREALVAGPSGLEDLRELVQTAPLSLNTGGWLLLEHGAEQAPAVASLFEQAGWDAPQHRPDLAGHVRCTGARWGQNT